MVRQTTTTTEATIYHASFDHEEDSDAWHAARDVRMGYEFACDHDADPEDVFDDVYVEAGTVTVESTGEDGAQEAWEAWVSGEGHDPTKVRGMSVGDIIVVDGDAYFSDRFGFVCVDVDLDGDQTDGVEPDRADRDDYYGMVYDPTPTDAEIAEAFGVDDVDDITDDMLDDVPDAPAALTDVVDLSDYATAHGAAKATARKLRAIAEEFGHKPDLEVSIRKVEDVDGSTLRWEVSYPAGDHDWAVRLTGGDAVYGGTTPLLTGFYGNDWEVECESSTKLGFYV